MGPAYCRKRLPNPVRLSTASFQRGYPHSGGSRAGSGNGTRSKHSLEEGGHRGEPSSRQRVRVLQPVLHRSKDGWRVASHFRSALIEPLSHATEVQDAHNQTSHVSDQVQGLACQDRSKRHILPCLHLSTTQKFPEVCFRGQSLPISGSSGGCNAISDHVLTLAKACNGFLMHAIFSKFTFTFEHIQQGGERMKRARGHGL